MSWPTVALSELIVDEIGGISLGRDDFFDQGFPVIPKKAVSADIEICEKSYAYTTHEIFSSYAKSFVDNSFVITVLRDLVPSGPNLGRVCLLRESKNYLLAQGVYGFKLAPECDPRYLAYISNTPNFREQVLRFKVGSTQVHVRGSEYKKVAIPLPPLLEQKRIAAILDKADAIRRKRQQAIKLADDFLRSVFLEMFGDPVTNPKGWEVKKLLELCTKITDGTHFSPPIVDDGIPYITAKHLKSTGLEFFKKPWYISKEHHDDIYSRCKPEKHDVLYIKDGATTGLAAINEYDFAFSMLSSLALLKPDREVMLPEFLCMFLNHPRSKLVITANMAGAAITRLTLAKIKAIEVPLPTINLQREFANIYRKNSNFLVKNYSALELTENQFESLSQKAFSGKI